MQLTAAQVFVHMRDLHPALSELNAPTPLGLREISREVRSLVAAIAVRVPAYLAQILDVSLPLADFDAGIDLSTLIPGGWSDLLKGELVYAEIPRPPQPAESVPWEQRYRPARLPAFTYRADVITLLGCAVDYAPFSAFRLSYSGTPPDVTTVGQTLALNQLAREALASGLAAFFLGRLVSVPAAAVTGDVATAYSQLAGQARAEYLTQVFRLTQRQRYTMNVTY